MANVRQRHVQKYVAVARNLGNRRGLAMQGRVLSELHSGKAAELYLHQYQGIIHLR